MRNVTNEIEQNMTKELHNIKQGTMATLSSLPEEILHKIVKDAALRGDVGYWSCCDLYKNNYDSRPCKFDHDFLVDVVSKISVRFEKISRDETFWEDEGSVFKLLCISSNKGPYLFDAQASKYVLSILWARGRGNPSIQNYCGRHISMVPTSKASSSSDL